MKRLLFIVVFLSVFFTCCAQNVLKQIEIDPRRSGATLCIYPQPQGNNIPYPKGYKPFYISHYGRHGSRYLTADFEYNGPLQLLQKAEDKACLTETGQRLLDELEIISEDVDGRYGDLTGQGADEQRGIGRRTAMNFPEVFRSDNGTPRKVETFSTIVIRCVLSMSAFDEGLKECFPNLYVTRESSKRNMKYMSYRGYEKEYSKQTSHVVDSLKKSWIHPERFFNSIISDPLFISENVKRPEHLMYNFFQIASNMQNAPHLNINLYDFFTNDELYDMWKVANIYAYVKWGPSEKFGHDIVKDARPLLTNMLDTAEKVISGESDVCASFRFGHDNHIIPLLALLEIEGLSDYCSYDDAEKYWNVSDVSPMAVNLQFVFFRNRKGDIKVRILHNERDAHIPLPGYPYYNWEDLSEFLKTKLN